MVLHYAHTDKCSMERKINTSAMNGKTEVLCRVAIKKETNGNFRTEKYHV